MTSFMSRAKPWTFLAAAILMPPKVDESQYEWLRDLKKLPQVRARSVSTWSGEAYAHGALRWSSTAGRLEILSPDASELELRALPSGTVVRRSPWAPGTRWESAAGKGTRAFFVMGENLEYRPAGAERSYWSVPLGGSLLREGWIEASKSWYGLSSRRPELYWLAPPYMSFYRVTWPADAEPVAFFPCDSTRAVLVENLPQGLTRFFFFRGGRPFAYTIFRLGAEGEGSDVSGALARGCQDFVVAGSFGLRFIEYSKW